MRSGSEVRPQKIYDAFLSEGHDVKLLSCIQNQRKRRKKAVLEIMEWLDANTPDICYVEPPSGPFFNHIDHILLKKAHKMGIPISLFYRDAFWKFAKKWWDIGALKKFFLIRMHKYDLRLFSKVCRIMYFPSQTMADLFSFPDKRPLPPAGDGLVERTALKNEIPRAIYVGGMSGAYGSKIMLEAFSGLNSISLQSHLTVVSREGEDADVLKPYIGCEWLSVVNASGNELKEHYMRSDYAVIPVKRDFYMDFAMHVKMFEYMSYGLPAVSTDCFETARFIEKYDIGIVTGSNPMSFKHGLERMISEPGLMGKCSENAKKALVSENLWIHRVRKIAGDLTK